MDAKWEEDWINTAKVIFRTQYELKYRKLIPESSDTEKEPVSVPSVRFFTSYFLSFY